MRLIPYNYPWTTRAFYSPDEPPAAVDPPKDDPDDKDLTDKGKAALQRERDARKAAEKSLTDLQAQVADLAKFKTDTETAAAAAAADKAKAEGQYEQVAKDAETARDAAKADLATAQQGIKDLQEAISTGLDDAFKALPEKVQKLWKGADDDVLGKFKFVHDPDYAAIVADLTHVDPANNGNRNPVDPANPNAPKVKPEDASKSQAPMYANF